ncbi:BrnA antitoxin family protein [Edaphobacter paludis]|uniref:BrnA antitoxin family protein n=1 Tax=Edaphobacter paludis TaxID=3035702 RepID=A0AAU7D9I7_9BACT
MSAHNTVKFKLDPNHPTSATAPQRKRLKRIAAMPDAEIDYSDIPRQTEAVQWTRPGALVPSENKQQVTLRLDADVLTFFKGTGKRYQSRINAALREYVQAHRKSA